MHKYIYGASFTAILSSLIHIIGKLFKVWEQIAMFSRILPLSSWTIFTREFSEALFYNAAHWYNFETLPQTDDCRRAAVESAHMVQSVHPIARWKAE